MFKTKVKINAKEVIFRTFFFSSLFSYLFFLALDLFFPGFVARSFSVHWFLLAIIVTGFLWSRFQDNKESENKISLLRRFTGFLIAGFIGLILGFFIWQTRAVFDDNLLVVLPLAFLTPFLVLWMLREN